MNAATDHPFRVGDKVRLKSTVNPRFGEGPMGAWNFNEMPRHLTIYVVRKAFIDAVNSVPAILLGGIHSILSMERGGEWAFEAAHFDRVGRRLPLCTPPAPEELLSASLHVDVPADVARQMRYLRLPNWVEPLCRVTDDHPAEVVIRKWQKKNPHQHVGVPFSKTHERIAAAVAAGDRETISVPLSPFAREDLEEIVTALGIPPEAWLQAVLGHLAMRVANAVRLESRRAPRRS